MLAVRACADVHSARCIYGAFRHLWALGPAAWFIMYRGTHSQLMQASCYESIASYVLLRIPAHGQSEYAAPTRHWNFS